MSIVSTQKFNSHQEKYFDLALRDNVIVQRDNNMFIVQKFIPNDESDVICEPDDDFYRYITMDEAIIRVEAGMR